MVFSSAVITFRETLEAALVVGIVLSFLYRTRQQHFSRYVWLGVFAAIAVSAAVAVAFQFLAGGFEGRAEQIFEAITMIVAAGLLSWMILWMFSQRMHLKRHVEEKASRAVEAKRRLELFLLSFVSVLREGVETVIFLGAATFVSNSSSIGTIFGGFGGVAAALAVSFLLFVAAKKVNLRLFFNVTSIVLVLFAAGLVAHGVHEFQEAKVLPETIEHVWNTGWLLDEKGFLGGMAKSLFGYNSDPSLLEVVAYAAYLAVICVVFARMSKTAAVGAGLKEAAR